MAKKEIAKNKVKSSNLDWVAYDKDTKTLYIQFLSGGLYSYSDVPEEIFTGLLNADSKGKFFWKNIRNNSSFKYTKMN